MKIIVTCSGGKDSVASLIWMQNNGYKNFEVVFCDTNWESEITYQYLEDLQRKLGIRFTFLKSKVYGGFIDLSRKKKRFPSTRARFCTSELKSIPMIDYILDVVKDNILVIQGIRGSESESRSKMAAQCNYFKYYLEPIETNSTLLPKLEKKASVEKVEKKRLKLIKQIKKVKERIADGKEDPKYHTYRRKEVLAYCKKFGTDILRPVFYWSGMDVINYALDNHIDINPLYKLGMKRVGCFPCIMCGLAEIHQIATRFPERIEEISRYELELNSSFFGPDKIPSKYYKGKYPLIKDVVKYAAGKYDAGLLFDDSETTSCMSYYGLCE